MTSFCSRFPSTCDAKIIVAIMNTQLTASSLFTDLQSRIGKRQAKVGIIGLGYVGLPLALLYSEQKFAVTGFDIDQRKIDTLDNGGTYIFRITPEESQRLQSHRRLLADHRHGRDYHLRPDAA
jgi:hypothetical protein